MSGTVGDRHEVVTTLTDMRNRLVSDGTAPGRAWCRAWTDGVDEALRQLAQAPACRSGIALVAVGGYGRRELCPASDVDLLLLHDRVPQQRLEQAVRAVVYPLWDAGLTVGYAVRDRREAIGAADDLDSATAMLDLRAIAGDETLVQLVRSGVLRRLGRRPHRFLEALRDADRERRRRAGDAAEVIEPNLKNGAGGLRDLQSLRWASAALVGSVGLDPLVPAGYLGAPDRARLARAEDRLLEARVALHLELAQGQEARPNGEVVRLELQDAIAARLGLVGSGAPGAAAPHRLLERLYLAARTIDHVHRRAWSLIEADLARGGRRRHRPEQRAIDGFELVDGVLRLPADTDLGAPELAVRLLATLTDSGALLDRASAARLRSHADASDAPWPWTDAMRERFVAVLWRGGIALPALAELDDVGALTRLLPEWTPLRGRPQRNPYHRFALDRHAWHAAAELGDLVRREPWAAETLEEVDDREGLLLGTLFHDVGKAFGEPHSETGIEVAEALARRMGARQETVRLVGTLVRLHLLVPDAARRRDVADPALARQIADQVGSRSLLACLHLLAAADGRATGSTAWSDWTAALTDRLVRKVRAVLDEKQPDEIEDGAVATARQAQELAPELGADPALVREHLALLPSRYAAAVSPRAVVRHSLMAQTRPSATEVATRVTSGETDPEMVEGIDELDVVALDHPGWFARVAGVLALHGGSILAADAFTRSDEIAVDTFKVRPPEGAGGSWWARVEGDLADAAAGRLAIRARVARETRLEDRRGAKPPEVPTQLTVAEDPAGRSTIVEIRTGDRVGVLYAIATALAELELDLLVARIQTLGHEVLDVFYVRDRAGQPLDSHHVAELELAVASAVAEA